MESIPKTTRPGIFLSDTDPDLGEGFSNGFGKYSNIQEMAGGGDGVLLSCYDKNLRR